MPSTDAKILMPDAFSTITNLIQSPPGQIAAGGALAAAVWKSFEKAEGVLTQQAKKDLGRRLRLTSLKIGLISDDYADWPKTFDELLKTVFGPKHLSFVCLWRSAAASLSVYAMFLIVGLTFVIHRSYYSSLPEAVGWPLMIMSPTMALCGSRGDSCSQLYDTRPTLHCWRFS